MGKTGLCWSVSLIRRFGIAAESNCCTAFENESTLVARCRPNKGLAIAGLMTGSRFISTLGTRFLSARASVIAIGLHKPKGLRPFPRDFQQSEIKKSNLSYVAITKQALKLKFKRKEK